MVVLLMKAMKKAFFAANRNKSIIFAILLNGLVIFVLLLSGCSWLICTYHMPRNFEGSVSFFENDKGELFYSFGYYIYRYYSEKEHEIVSMPFDEEIFCSYFDGVYFYYFVLPDGRYMRDGKIIIMDCNFQLIKTVSENVSDDIRSMTADGSFLYCFSEYRKGYEAHGCLFRYNLITLEKTILVDDFNYGDYFTDGSLTIFLEDFYVGQKRLVKTGSNHYHYYYNKSMHMI